MRNVLIIPIAVLALVMFESSAWAQGPRTSVVTPSPSIHRGNHSQSAIHVGPQRVRTFPGSVINILPHRRGHHNFFYPKPHVRRHVHSSYCHFTPQHYTTQYRQTYVPAHYEQQYVPPRYEYRYTHGHRQKVLAAYGYTTRIYVKAHYVSQPYRQYVPASWSCGFYF